MIPLSPTTRIVMAILGILASLLLPALSQVRRKAHQVVCVSNVGFVDGHVELVRLPELWILTWNLNWVPGPEPRRGGLR